jgi:putative transposase
VKIHHVYYWTEAFRDPRIQGNQVAVRYDPFDAGIAFAFVHKQWVRCHSEPYAVLKSRSEREVMLATQELRRRSHNHSATSAVTGQRLAEFLQSVEAEEVLLTQRLSDLESGVIRLGLTNGGGRESCGTIPHCSKKPVPESDGGPKGELVADEVYGEF